MIDRDSLLVTIFPTTSRYAVEDPRRQQETNELAEELRRVVTVVPAAPDPGSKGALETATAITVMLSSLSAVRYAVAAFRVWVERDAKREAEIKIHGRSAVRSVHVRLKGFDEDALTRVLEAAKERRTLD